MDTPMVVISSVTEPNSDLAKLLGIAELATQNTPIC